MLAELVRVVTSRATRVGGIGARGAPADLEALRRAVEALDSYVDVLHFLRHAAADSGTTQEPVAPRSVAPARQAGVAAPRGWEAEDREAPVAPKPEARFPAFRDEESGLLSRTGFEAIVNGEIGRSARASRPLTVLLFRIPPSAEGAIGTAAPVLRDCVRASDVVGRDPDGTLLIALPETEEREAAGVLSRIAHRLTGVGAWDDHTRAGISTFPADGETLGTLLDRARRRHLATERGGSVPDED